MERLTMLETAYFNHKISEATTIDPIQEAAQQGTDEIAALLRAWIDSTQDPLELLRRYLATLQHQFNTTLANLLKLETRADQRRIQRDDFPPYKKPEFPAVLQPEQTDGTKQTQSLPRHPAANSENRQNPKEKTC